MLLHTESFEVNPAGTFKYASNTGFNPQAGGRTGNAGQINGGDIFSRNLDSGSNMMYYGVALNMNAAPTVDTPLLLFGETYTSSALGVYHAALYITTARQLRVVRGNNIATIATGSRVLDIQTFYWIEIGIKCHSTLGEVEVRIDTMAAPAEIGPLTGQNTRNGGAGIIPAFQLHWPPGFWLYDDLYVCNNLGTANNTFRGLCAVQTRDALTDAASGGGGDMKDWALSGGTDHGAVVDEVAMNGDTDFIYSNTPGHIDTFNMQDITLPSASIAGVIVYNHARKTDVGNRTINGVCRIGGVNYVSPVADQLLATTYAVQQSVFDVDPSTGAAWASQAAVNAAQFGPKLIS